MTLKERFETFVTMLDGHENIDQLLSGREIRGKKRADYLFRDRSIIIEQKTLEQNPGSKIVQFVTNVIKERGIVVDDTMTAHQILDTQPDALSLKNSLYLRTTKVLEGLVEGADKQTSDTRNIFDIPLAAGILVILNEKAITIDPYDISRKTAEMFLKRKAGRIRYRNNRLTIIISELHLLNTDIPRRILPLIGIEDNNVALYPAAMEFTRYLDEKWAEATGYDFTVFSNVKPEDMRFKIAN